MVAEMCGFFQFCPLLSILVASTPVKALIISPILKKVTPDLIASL